MKTRIKHHLPKVALLVGSIVILLVGAGVVALGSRQWDAADSEAQQHLQLAYEARAAATSPSGGTSSKQAAVEKLASLKSDSQVCQGSWWFAWQSEFIPGAREAQKRCQTAVAATKKVTGSAAELNSYLGIDKRVVDSIKTLRITSTEINWQTKASEAATDSLLALKLLKGDKTSQPLITEAIKRVEVITKSWKALETASKKQDRKAYEVAYATLKDAYSNLAAISDVSDAQITELVTGLTSTQ